MVKSIIKRIIVGVSIALILMLCKEYILLDVHAESINIIPDKICAINNYNDSCNFSNVNTYTLFERPMYGNQFGADTYRGRVIWHFTGNNIKEKTYNISFTYYLEAKSADLFPGRGYIGNGADNIFSCSFTSTKWNRIHTSTSSTATLDYVTGSGTVECNNVYLNENYFNFYFFDLDTISGGKIAISHATITENVTAKQTKELEEINDNITSEEAPSDDDIGSIFDSDEDTSNTPVSSLITMPITLLQKFNDGFSASCGSYDLGSLYGHHIILPCIDLEGLLGSDLWSLIDMLFSLFLVYNIGLMCIDIYESITSLDDGFRSLYTPKHGPTAYQPKHGGGS